MMLAEPPATKSDCEDKSSLVPAANLSVGIQQYEEVKLCQESIHTGSLRFLVYACDWSD
jgi:hypothetical protein